VHMASVRFDRVYKLFGDVPAVEDLKLEISDGEFVVLVGPSGCGKTTSLRMLAGFERATYGTVSISDQSVNSVLPKDRDVAMVFQSYALYPHMTVGKNLSFGLKVRHERRHAIQKQVEEIARTLGIEDLLDRRPSELSGGQRQRVALGRALLRRPRAFLMDEPLSNLDAALRVQMRVELKRLHGQLGTTTIYVTHDQVEAMTMGSRIALMNRGRLQQFDTPEHVYGRPANLFAASFIGSPKMNLIPGRIVSDNGAPAVESFGRRLPIVGEAAQAVGKLSDRDVIVGIRPEDLRWGQDAPTSCAINLKAAVEVVEPLGSESYVVARIGDEVVTSRFPPRSGISAGSNIELAINPDHLHFFDAKTEQNVLVEPTKAVPSVVTVEEPRVSARANTRRRLALKRPTHAATDQSKSASAPPIEPGKGVANEEVRK
jgi:multiple sugar transport system ATP-binding protein